MIDLDHRLQNRRKELEQERQRSVGDIHYVGSAWVMPHPERDSPSIAQMVSDPEIERIAIQTAIRHEEA